MIEGVYGKVKLYSLYYIILFSLKLLAKILLHKTLSKIGLLQTVGCYCYIRNSPTVMFGMISTIINVTVSLHSENI